MAVVAVEARLALTGPLHRITGASVVTVTALLTVHAPPITGTSCSARWTENRGREVGEEERREGGRWREILTGNYVTKKKR